MADHIEATIVNEKNVQSQEILPAYPDFFSASDCMLTWWEEIDLEWCEWMQLCVWRSNTECSLHYVMYVFYIAEQLPHQATLKTTVRCHYAPSARLHT